MFTKNNRILQRKLLSPVMVWFSMIVYFYVNQKIVILRFIFVIDMEYIEKLYNQINGPTT